MNNEYFYQDADYFVIKEALFETDGVPASIIHVLDRCHEFGIDVRYDNINDELIVITCPVCGDLIMFIKRETWLNCKGQAVRSCTCAFCAWRNQGGRL